VLEGPTIDMAFIRALAVDTCAGGGGGGRAGAADEGVTLGGGRRRYKVQRWTGDLENRK
jgi:hypothetical protein